MLETQETEGLETPPPPHAKGTSHIDHRSRRVVWAAAVIFAVWMFLVLASLHRRYGTQTFDMAIFDQALWLLSRFEEPFVTIRGLHLFADHTSYILVLLAPLYWIASDTHLLMIVSIVVLAIGGPITYSIARRSGLSNMVSLSLAFAYLLHPAVAWNVWDFFHPEVIAVPLILAAYLAALHDKWKWVIVALVGALLVKEDAAIAVVPFAIYLAVRFKRREGYGLAAFGTGLLAFNMLTVLPAFSPTGDLTNNWRYQQFGLGLGGAVKGMLTKPGLLFTELFGAERTTYYLQLLGPAPAALFAPEVLLVAAPITAANALSYHGYQYQIEFHYTVYALALITIAATAGAVRLRDRFNLHSKSLASIVLAAAVAGSVLVSPWPQFRQNDPWAGSVHSAETREILDAALAMIPGDAPVSADWFTVTHLAHRRDAYMLPNPFQNRWYGAGEPYEPTPDDVDWVVAQRWALNDLQVSRIMQDLEADPGWETAVDNPVVLVMKRVGAPSA